MLDMYSTNKWYVDGQLPNHVEIAQAVAARFPHLRLAIGPTLLNAGYKGGDKPQIESVVQSMGGAKAPGAELKAPTVNLRGPGGNSPAPETQTRLNPGDKVLVTIPAIGELVATFVRMQGAGAAVVDLDGIEETVELAVMTPLHAADMQAPSVPTASAEPPAPPAEAKTPSAPPAPPAETKEPPLEVVVGSNEPPPADGETSGETTTPARS